MTWQETAKKLAEQPWWEWQEGMISADFGLDLYPDLTDWATVGILLGMVVECDPAEEIALISCAAEWSMEWSMEYGLGLQIAEIPGQAIAELLMELRGGDHE